MTLFVYSTLCYGTSHGVGFVQERPDERLLQRLRGFRRGTVEWLDGFASQSHEVLGAQHGMFDTWTNAICANLRLRHETSWIIITNRIDDYSRCHD